MNMLETIGAKSDQMNADDLIGGPRTITVRDVKGNQSSPEQPVNVFFDGDEGKPFRPCLSMRRVMAQVWGLDAKTYVGKSMRLYRDPEVSYGGVKVGGIRISHMSHLDRERTLILTASRTRRLPFVVRPLDVRQAAAMADEPSGAATPELLEAARAKAHLGTDRFREWWRADRGRAEQLTPHREELRKICSMADAHMDKDPFGLPPSPGDIPTDPLDDSPVDDRQMPMDEIEKAIAARDAKFTED